MEYPDGYDPAIQTEDGGNNPAMYDGVPIGSPEYVAKVEAILKEEAAKRGVTYDPTDLDGFVRNATNGHGDSWDGAGALANQISVYERRAGSTSDRKADSQSALGNYLYGSGSGNASNTPGGAYNGPAYQGSGGGSGSGGGNWFSANAPSLSNYGAPPSPFGETYTPETYTPPTWTETFSAPTAADLEASPGYLAAQGAMQRGLERSAASKGSVLSGGFAGRTLPRALGEFASTEYGNLFNRAYDTYKQRYGEFSDSAARGQNAFALNEGNRLNSFNTRYRTYQDNVMNTRNAESDRWGREMDLARLGLDATTAGRP